MTTNGVNFLNSEEAAKVLGVNVSTIKRWTDEGKLECIQTAGGHRKFLMNHLSEFLDKNKKKAKKVNVFTIESHTDLDISYRILKGDFEFLIQHVYTKALITDRYAIQKVLNGLYLGRYPLYEIYDKLITPVLHHIGYLWMEESISIIEEHLASQTIRDAVNRLQGIIHVPEHNGDKALCISLSNDLHDIALKMVQHILEVRGFKTYFSGQLTPILKIENVFEKFHPQRLYISCSIVSDREVTQTEVNELFSICNNFETQIYIGGRGWDQLDYAHPNVVKRLYTFEEVYHM
jgi:excisionase family DNA binding protein